MGLAPFRIDLRYNFYVRMANIYMLLICCRGKGKKKPQKRVTDAKYYMTCVT